MVSFIKGLPSAIFFAPGVRAAIGLNRIYVGRTEEEVSPVCITEDTPDNTLEREDGWRSFKIQSVLDFSLIGILSGISTILAEAKIGIFVVSTYNTDYILVKKENFDRAMRLLEEKGYSIV